MATGFQTPEFSLEEQRRALDPDYDKQRTAEEALEKADEQVQDLLAMGAGYGNNTHSTIAPEGIAEDPLSPDERRDANNRYDKQNQGKLNVPTDSPLFSFDLDKAKELAQQQRDIEIVPRFGKWEDMSPAERGEEAYRQVEKEMQENPQARAGVEGTSIVGKDNIPILGSFLTAADASALQVTAKNIVDGKAEPADYILFAKAMHQANHDAQKGLLEQTGEAIVDVGSLMFDYALSGGALSGAGLGNATKASVAGKKAAEGAVKKEIFDKALEKIGKGWFKQGALKTGQHVSKVAVNAAKRGVMYAPRAAETMAGRGSIDDFIIDKKGNYQFKEEEDSAGRDLFEAVATAYAEIVIEEIIPDGVLAGLAKGSKSKAIKKLGEFMTKAGETKVGKAASVGGFGGMLGEIGEERLTELANYVITNEEDQLGTSKAIWDAVASGDPEKINKAFEMAVPEVGAISFIAAGRAGANAAINRKNIPASPDVIPGAADVDDIQDIQVEPGQRQEIAPEDMPDVQVEPTDLTQRAERPIEGETGHIGADGTPVRTSKPAPPTPRAEVLPEGHPALGDVDTRAEPPEVKIPDLKPDHIQGDPDPQAPLEIPPPTTDDTVEAPPVIPDVEAPPVIEDKPDLKPSHIKDDVDPQAPLTPDYTDSIKTDVPVAKRATRAQQAEQTQQMDTSGDINNPIERLDMKDEGNYREDIDALIKRSKKAGGKVSRNDIKSIGYLDGNLYDNKNYDFSKASERKRFVKEAEQRLKEGRQQTQKAQEQQRQPVVKVVPEPTKTKPLKLKDALKNVQEQERYKEAEEIKGSRQAASRYDIDYGEQRRQEKRDTAAREINKVLMKGIPAKSDNEQENNERSQLINERLNTLAGSMGVEVDANMSIKEKKDAILDKNEQVEQEDFEATVKEGMERDKRTSPWLDIEANWEAETKAKVPLPPGYGYSKDGKIIKPGQKVSKAKKSTAEQRPKATNESLKRLNEINNEIANLKVKPQNADTRGNIENLQQEREDVVNAHNARVIKRKKPDPTIEPSKKGEPTAKEDTLNKEEQTETEKIQSEIDKEVKRYSKIENPTESQIGYNRRKLERLRKKKADLKREYEAAQDEVAEGKETKAQEKAEVQEEGTALERMQELDLELTKLRKQRQDAPTRAKIARIQADKRNLAEQAAQELADYTKKNKKIPPPIPSVAKEYSEDVVSVKNRNDAVPIDTTEDGVKIFSLSQENKWSEGVGVGWKFHLNVKPENLESVYEVLDELGLFWKGVRIGTNTHGKVVDDKLWVPKKGHAYGWHNTDSPENNWENTEGKPITVYGTYEKDGDRKGNRGMSRDFAMDIAKKINDKVGDKIEPAAHSVLIDDAPLLGNIWARFDIRDDSKMRFPGSEIWTNPLAKKTFARYGAKGMQNIRHHFDAQIIGTDKTKYAEGMKLAHGVLTDQFGTYFQGTGKNKFEDPYAKPEAKAKPEVEVEAESLVPKDVPIYELIHTSTDKYRDVLERGPVPSEHNRSWVRRGVSLYSNELEDTGGKNHAFTINPSRKAGQRNQGALTQVGFPGRDQTGRSNFMAHSFVINTKEDLDISPAKIIKQMEFKNDWREFWDKDSKTTQAVKERSATPTIDGITDIEAPSVIPNELAQEIADAILDRKTVQVQIVYDSKNLSSNLDVMVQVSELLPKKQQWKTTFSTQHGRDSKTTTEIKVQFLHAEDASSPSSRVKVFNITNEVKSKPEPKPEPKVEPKPEPKPEPKVEPEPPKKTPAQKKKAKKAGKAKYSRTELNKDIKEFLGPGISLQANKEGGKDSFIIKTTRNAQFKLKPDASIIINEPLIKEGESVEDAQDRWMDSVLDPILMPKDETPTITQEQVPEIDHVEESTDTLKELIEEEQQSKKAKKGTPKSQVNVEGTPQAEWVEKAVDNEQWVMEQLKEIGVDVNNLTILPDQFDEAFHDRDAPKDFSDIVYGDNRKGKDGKAIDISKLEGDKGWKMVLEALLQKRAVHLSLNKANFQYKPNTLEVLNKQLEKSLAAIGKTVQTATAEELKVISNNVAQQMAKRAEPARVYDHMVFDKKNLRLISQDGTFTLEWKYNPADAYGSFVVGGPAIGHHNNKEIPFNIEMAIKMTPEEFSTTNWDMSTVPPSAKTVLMGKEWDKLSDKEKKKYDNKKDYDLRRVTSFHENLIRWTVPKETSGAKSTENLNKDTTIAQEAEMKARTYRRRTPYKVMKAYPDIFSKELKEFEQRREEKLGPNPPAPSDNLSLEHIEHLFSPLDVKPMRNVPANLQVNEKAVRAFAGGVTIAKTRSGYVIRTPRGDVNIVHVNDIRHLDGMELKRYEGVYTKKQLEAAAKHQPMGVYVRGKGKRKYGVTDLGTIYLNSHPDSMADMGTLTEELFHVADVMGFINSADRRKLVQKYSSLDKDFLTQSEEIAHALKKMERKDRTFVLGALRKFLRKLMKLFNIDDSVGRVMLDAMKTGTIWETRDDVRAKRINSMLDARDLLFSPSTTPPRRQARKTKEQIAAESTPAGAAASLPARKEYDENLIRERDAENRRQARAQINNDGFMNSVEDVLNKFNNMSMLGMSSVDMQKAKLLHDQFFELEQDPTHSSNPEFILLASYYREAYRYAGTVAARALNARKNPALTEEEAIEATLIEAVYMPNSKKARRLAELVGVAKEYSSPSLMDSDMLSGDSVTIDNDGNIVGTQGGTGGVPAGQGPGKGPGKGPGQGPGAGKGTSFPGWNAASISKLPKSKQAEARNILNDLIKERKELLDFLRRQGFDLSKSGLAAIRKNPVRARQLLDAVSWKKAHQVDKVFAWLKHIFYNNLLSGIRTQVTNITSNIVYRKYRQFEQAAGRALFFGLSDINAIEKSLTGADLKEWKRVVRKIERTASQARGTGKVLSNEYQEALDFINRGMGAAFANAVSTFHTDQSAVDSERLTADELDWYRKEGIVTPVATSSFGKKFISITGTPTKLLRSGDEFFRSLTLNNMAGAFAASEARLAVARGEIGTADIDAYIIKQLNNRNSHAWDRAHKAASELVHQETDEGVRGFVINLIETVDKKIKSIKDVSVDTKFSTVAHLTANILDLGLRVFALPFRRTPINLIGKGIARSPVLGMSLNGLQVIKNKAEGRAAFDGIEGESFASLMSTIMMMAMIAWGDDEEEGIGWKNFGWTGTRQGRDYREKIHGYREGVAGPNQLRLFGHTFNYANVEPFSSAMSIMADIADAHKDDDSVMGELVKAPANLVEDRSFTQGLDNWYKVTRGEDRAAGVFADALSSFLVPNLVKQLSRESKNYVTSKTADSFMGRLKKSAELPEWLNKMIGIDKTPPVVDAWGMVARNEFREPFSKGIGSEATGLLANLASPMFKYSGSNETFIGDKPYVEWNRANPDNKMFPMSFAGKPWERSFTYKGTKYQMSESDYAHMQYYAGGIAAELAKSLVSPKMAEELSKKTEHQAKFDMLRIKEFRRKSFEYVRSAYLKKRMYDVDIEKGAKAVIDDIKESYLEANSGKTKAWLKNEFLNQPDSDEYKDALAWRRYYEWITRGQ